MSLPQAPHADPEGSRVPPLPRAWGTRAPRGQVPDPKAGARRVKDGLQCEAGTTRREPPRRVHLSVETFATGKPLTPEPREPRPKGRGNPDASPAGTGTRQGTGSRGACSRGPHPRTGQPSEGLGRECPGALAGTRPGPPAGAPLG